MRRTYEYIGQSDFRGGICLEPENARKTQVLDARNVWAPQGRLIQRPGYRGVWSPGFYLYTGLVSIDDAIAFEDVSASTLSLDDTNDYITFTPTGQDDNGLGDHLYFGFTTVYSDILGIRTLCHTGSGVNATAQRYKLQYYSSNGNWEFLPSRFYGIGSGLAYMPWWTQREIQTPYGAQNASGYFNHSFIAFVWPNDAATTTLDYTTYNGSVTSGTSSSYYWLRMTFIADPAATGTTDTQAGRPTHFLVHTAKSIPSGEGEIIETTRPQGAFAVQFPQTKRYFLCYNVYDATSASPAYGYNLAVTSQATLATPESFSEVLTGVSPPSVPSMCAPVPEFNEAYIAHDYTVSVHHAYDLPSGFIDDTNIQTSAIVEDDTDIISGDSAYNSTTLPQLTTFPEARYILWFKDKLWVANLKGSPFEIRWSAPPLSLVDGTVFRGHRVWPAADNYTLLESDDNSPITGMATLGEHIIVFTEDSIWRMVFTGFGALTGLELYDAVKVTTGIGCVSNASIAQTPYGLMFLAEDGVYLFDGNQARKISGAVDEFMDNVTYADRAWFCGVHWSDKNCYLLAVNKSGANGNNHVLVFDYKHMTGGEEGYSVPAIWIWDSLNVRHWMLDENETSDKQVLYFMDYKGCVHLLDWGATDYGNAVTAYVTTHRLGDDVVTRSVRDVRINATSDVTDLSVTVQSNDEDSGQQTTGTLSMQDANDVQIGDFAFSSTSLASRRRTLKRISFRKPARWFSVKVQNSNINQRLALHSIRIGTVPLGVR